MKKLIISCLVILSAVLPARAQEEAPLLDTGFGIKPFAMDDSWIIDVKQISDGGFYVAGAWEGIARLDAAGNKLWSAPYTATGDYADMQGGIAVDDADNVYAGIYEYPVGKIIKYDPAGNQVKSYAVDDVLFGVVFNIELNRLYAVTGGGIILMLDSDLNFISSVSCGEPGSVVWAEGGIGIDTAGNIYVSGWVQSGTTKRLAGYKYSAGLVKLWEYSEPIGSSPFIAGEAIPGGGMYLVREYRLSPPSLLNISNDGVKLWEKQIPEDYHYYKGVDNAGNFYGATWDENNDWAVTISKLGYIDGAVEWSLPELFSGEADDILWDGQGRLYTFGSLMEPSGADGMYVARYGGDTEAPAAVSGLAVTAVSSNSITLSWTAPGDDGIIGTATSYDLRYATVGPLVSDTDFDNAAQLQGEPVPQAAGGVETFTIAGLAPGTTYFFGIKTTDDAGNVSGLSNSPAAMILSVDTTPSAAVSDLAATAVSSNTVTLAWTAPGDDGIVGTASSYDIRYTTAGVIASTADFNFATQVQGEPAPQIAGSTETFTVTSLAPGTTYFFGIRTADDAGNISGLSNCVFTRTCVEVTGVPNWKQFNDPGNPNTWWDDIYDHTTNLIKKSGCALTAVAQVVKKLGFNKNPGELNDLLNNTPNGFTVDSLVNPDVVKIKANLEYGVYKDNKESRMLAQLQSGNPVILHLWSLKERASGERPSHFVVVVGKCGDTIYIYDPGHSSIYSSRPTLKQYFNKLPVDLREIRDIRYYKKK